MADDTVRRFLRKPVSKFRSDKVTGPKPSVDRAGGFNRAGLIGNFAVITRGPALGHGLWVNRKFVADTVDAINMSNRGIKSRFTHPSMSGDGLGSALGRVHGGQVIGDKAVADLHFLDVAHRTPDGDLATYVMDLAESGPDQFGASIVFEGEVPETQKDFDPLNADKLPEPVLTKLWAVDLVDEPAANPDGLFHQNTELVQDFDCVFDYALGRADRPKALLAFSADPDRVRGYVQRYLAARGLEIRVRRDPEQESLLRRVSELQID